MGYAEVLNTMKERTGEADPARLQGIDAIFQLELTGDDGGTFYVKVSDGKAELTEGTADNPNVTVTVSVSDYEDLIAGKLDGTSAFMSGKLKIAGDMSLAMKLSALTG